MGPSGLRKPSERYVASRRGALPAPWPRKVILSLSMIEMGVSRTDFPSSSMIFSYDARPVGVFFRVAGTLSACSNACSSKFGII